MLAQLRMELETEELNYKKSSNLQGVLYENIDPLFVEKMHSNKLNPFSQYLSEENGKSVWYINTLNIEAYNEIILRFLDGMFQGFQIKNGNLNVNIKNKQISITKKDDLLKEFYENDSDRNINIEILTPTSFKQNGKYVILPDLRLIYQSLMNKYSSSSENMDMFDEDTLNQLVSNSKITRYKLRSTSFPMEGVNIPGFLGNLSIGLSGTESIKRYIRLLFKFGQYSGIGVKTSIGMGAIKLI